MTLGDLEWLAKYLMPLCDSRATCLSVVNYRQVLSPSLFTLTLPISLFPLHLPSFFPLPTIPLYLP